MIRSLLALSPLVLLCIGWILMTLSTDHAVMAIPVVEDGEEAVDEGEKKVPWWNTLLQNDQTNMEIPLGLALIGAVVDIASHTYHIQKNNHLAKEKADLEAHQIKLEAKRKRGKEKALAMEAAAQRAFLNQEERLTQQLILSEYLAEQRMVMEQYIDNQIKWEKKRQWLQLPQTQETIYTRDSFASLAPQHASNKALYALFLKTKIDMPLPLTPPAYLSAFQALKNNSTVPLHP